MASPTKPVGGTAAGEQQTAAKRRSSRETSRSVALVVLAAVIVAFAVANLKQVKVDWIFGSGHAPLIIVILISLVVGILIAHFADRLARRRRERA